MTDLTADPDPAAIQLVTAVDHWPGSPNWA